MGDRHPLHYVRMPAFAAAARLGAGALATSSARLLHRSPRPQGGVVACGYAALLATCCSLLTPSLRAFAQSDGAPGPPAASATAAGGTGFAQQAIARAARRHSLYQDIDDLYGAYSRFKTGFQKDTGLQWSVDATFMQQSGTPDGGRPAPSVLGQVSLDWNMFSSPTLGAGSAQLLGFYNGFVTQHTVADMQSTLGVVTPPNAWTDTQNQFAQLTYTQTLPGGAIALAGGQYPVFNFDTNQYLGNSQLNFINYVLAQNGSAAYADAGLGGFVQWNASGTLQFAAGAQAPNNASFSHLRSIDQAGTAWFGYAQWTPSFKGLGGAQYSLTWYDNPGQQGTGAHGWSLNAVQNLDPAWAVFGRANGASGNTGSIEASYAVGVALNDPLHRSATDQIGVAVGLSRPAGYTGADSNETIVEAYWNWTFLGGLVFAPDVQYIGDPALNPAHDRVWVLSLRATVMF